MNISINEVKISDACYTPKGAAAFARVEFDKNTDFYIRTIDEANALLLVLKIFLREII